MTFALYVWLWLLPALVIGVAVFLAWSWRRRAALLQVMLDTPLHDQLLASLDRRRRFLKQILFVLGLAFLALALARPQRGREQVKLERTGVDLILAFDVSRSMLAEDVDGTNRLAAARAAWFNTEGPTILYAGRLGHEKNLDLLIDAFLRLGPTDPDARLILAGDGPNRADYAARLANCPNAVFTGRLDRDDLRACYALADLFAFPSTTDTFGMAVLEAQVFGLPALVTDVGGPQEIVRPGTTGFVLPPDDPAVWTANLRRLVARRRSDPEDYARWRAEIAATAVSEHGWDRVIDDLVAHPLPGAAP